MNKIKFSQKFYIIIILILTFVFASTVTYAALTFNATTITSDGDLLLTPAGNVGINAPTPNAQLELGGIGKAVTDNYGLYVDDKTAGTNNYNIWSGPALSSFNSSFHTDIAGTGESLTAVSLDSQTNYPIIFASQGSHQATIYSGVHATGNSSFAVAIEAHGYADSGMGETVDNLTGLLVDAGFKSGAGTVTDNLGLDVSNQTAGTNNWAIRTGLGKVQFGDVLKIDPTTFASLPTCNGGAEGTIRPIADSTTVVFNATITGSGSNHIIAYCNGTNWTVH